MKKLLTIALLLSIICTVALAELDVKSMTDEQLMQTILDCSQEFRDRYLTDKGVLLYQDQNFSVYQTGDAYVDKNGRVKVPAAAYSQYDSVVTISPKNCTVNGFTVIGFGFNNIAQGAAMIGELDFASEKLNLTSIEQVLEITLQWQAYFPDSKQVELIQDRYTYHF